MADIEHACFLNELPGEPPEGFTRLYFGAEFCYWRFPSANNLLAARQWCREVGWAFTLVTPVLGEHERQCLELVLQKVLPGMNPGDEVLISDWGALELVRSLRKDLVIILGRTLSGQKRGPRILDMELTPLQREYFQKGAWHNLEAVLLLEEQGIKRIEQDNLLQGVAPLVGGLQGSLHTPYAMVTSSRNCPFRADGDTGSCPAPCGEVFTLQSSETQILLYQDGNSQFLLNNQLPDNLADLGIDRVVTHPQVGC